VRSTIFSESPFHSPGGVVRILIADDQEAVRKRICATLLTRTDFEVCGQASNGREAVEKAKQLNPDLVVLDITMPELNGFEAAREIRIFAPQTPIVVLSVHKSRQLIEEAKKVGASGYVTKEEAVQKLIQAVDAVFAQQTFFPADL
jgi:DNA-binding NarL/FixJ family response regulator